jgi:hypothetical protein
MGEPVAVGEETTPVDFTVPIVEEAYPELEDEGQA